MMNETDIEYWQRFVRNWVLVNGVQEESNVDLKAYNYESINREIDNMSDDDDDDDID